MVTVAVVFDGNGIFNYAACNHFKGVVIQVGNIKPDRPVEVNANPELSDLWNLPEFFAD